jgi:phosphoglycerate kinase
VDAIVAPSIDEPAKAHAVKREAIPPGEAMYDIGPESIRLFMQEIMKAKTILWNGPMGVFEKAPFDAATNAISKALANGTRRGATTIVGGGDSAAAVAELGLESQMSHVSTGGGASLEFLEGRTLPGVAALDDK